MRAKKLASIRDQLAEIGLGVAPVVKAEDTPEPIPVDLERERYRIEAERMRRSFRRFVRKGWKVLHPGSPLYWSWHMSAVCDHVQAMFEELAKARVDENYKMRAQNLLVNIPPRSAKSMIVSVFAPAWAWARWPDLKIRCVSANPRVSSRDSRYCRELIASEWYQDHFEPQWHIRPDIDAIGLFANTARGERHASGFNAKITGEGTDVIIVDDPHDAHEANSDVKRQSVLDKWDTSIANRVNDPVRSVRIGIMQRLHEADWSGHVLVQGNWEWVCIPQEFDPKRARVTFLGWRDPRTEPGELMHPERFPPEFIAAEKKRLGSYGYAGQHQQIPAPAEGGIFRRKWWRWYYDPNQYVPGGWERPDNCNSYKAREIPTSWDWIVLSVDAAFKKTEEGSRVSIQVWGGVGPDRFLLLNRTRPMTFSETCEEILRIKKMFPKAFRVLIEDKANGPAIVDVLRTRISGVIEVKPEGGKDSRAHACSPQVESGNVYLRDGDETVDSFVHELGVFPNGEHDDQLDSFTQALIYMTQGADVARAAMLGTM